MTNSQNKTTVHAGDVVAFIDSVADQHQREDAFLICALMARLSGEPAKMWGSSIIGFGDYHYKYESGREGTSARIAFSPRKAQTVIYFIDGYEQRGDLLARLGKHKIGKACLYIKRLADIDVAVLEAMISASLAYMDQNYPKGK